MPQRAASILILRQYKNDEKVEAAIGGLLLRHVNLFTYFLNKWVYKLRHEQISAEKAREEAEMDGQKPKEGQTSQEIATQTTTRPPLTPDPAVSGPLAKFEAWLYEMLIVKAPIQLPKTSKDWIVQYGPWITLVVGVLLALMVLPGLTTALALMGFTATYGGLYGTALLSSVIGPMFYMALIFLAAELIALFVSIPMLLKRQRRGWLLLFYAGVLSLAYTILNAFSYGFFDLGGLLLGLIGAVVGMYFIFQIRSYYKN